MRRTRLFSAESNLAVGTITELEEESCHYLIKVLRCNSGDHITLFTGDGCDYHCVIEVTGKRVAATVEAVKSNDNESPIAITLVQSLAKGTKLDLVIQKATELGVSRIAPISTERSVLKVDANRLNKKLGHWRKVAMSACAQCNRSVVPTIDPVVDFPNWLRDHHTAHSVLIHPEGEYTFNDIESCADINIIVGPEGGFSANEIQQAKDHNIKILNCGPRVMRTETAGFAAIAIVQAAIGDMG